MKKILLILLIVLYFAFPAIAQQTVGIFTVPNATTAFGRVKSSGTMIFNKDDGSVVRLTAIASATDTLTTATTSLVTGRTTIVNPIGNLYINGGNSTQGGAPAEGSHYFTIDPETGFTIIYKIISGIPQPATLLTGPNSIFVGLRVGIAAAGHHIVTEDTDGHFHFHAHSKWDGQLSTSNARIIDAYNYEARRILQSDESGTFLGTSFEFIVPATTHAMVGQAYFKTDTTVSTTPLRIQVWEGTDDTGPRVLDQKYPASDFSPSTEEVLTMAGFLEFNASQNYFFRVSSDNNFSLKTNTGVTVPWIAVNVSDIHEDDLLQTTEWISGDTFTAGQWSVQNKKVYICNTTGVQNGTFASNIALWDLLSHEGNDFWEVSGTTLQNKSGVDTFIFNDDTRDRLTISTLFSGMNSPSGAWGITVSNGGFSLSESGQNRIFASDALSAILSPDSNSQVITANAGVTIEGLSTTIKDATRNRIYSDSSKVGIVSPDGAAELTVDNNSLLFAFGDSAFEIADTFFQYELNFVGRFAADTLNSRLVSPDASNRITLTNSDTIIQSTDFNVNDGTRDRVTADTADTRMVSPDGTEVIYVDNDGINVPTVIATDNSTKAASTAFVTSHETNGQWTRTGTDLKPTNSGDTVTLDSSLYQPVFGDETGLILDIPFEQYGTDTIQEDKSLSHEGVGSGGVIVSADNGQYGSGAFFDGIDDKIDIDYDAALNPVIFTAEVRVKVTGGAGTFRSPLTSREASPKKGYTIYANNNNIWQVLFSNGTSSWRELNGSAVVLGEWTDVTLSYDGTTMSLYVNSVLVDSAISSYTPSTQFPTRIGAGATEGTGDFFFPGSIDHVKIYDRALAIEEIRTPYLRHGGRSVVKSDNFRIIDSNNITMMRLSNDGDFAVNDGLSNRVSFDVAKIQLTTGSGVINIRDDDIELYTDSQLRLDINIAESALLSPDGTNHLGVSNSQVEIVHGGLSRLNILNASSVFQGPSATNKLSLFATSTELEIAGVNRLTADATDTVIAAPIVANNLSISNTVATFTIPSFIFNDKVRNRIIADATEVKLVSPDGTNDISVDNTNATYNGNELTTHASTTYDIYTAAELTALATSDVITVSGVLTLNIKAAITSTVRYALTTGCTLNINIDNGVNYIYSDSGDFFSGDGSLRLDGGVLLAVGGGILFNVNNTSTFQTLWVSGCQIFGWNLGSIDFAILFIRQSAVINHSAPLVITNLIALKVLDFAFARIGSAAINDSIFEIVTGEANRGSTPDILISDVTGQLPTNDSLINLRPSIDANLRTTISSTLVGTEGGTLFNEDESTGTFTVVVDASIGTTAITSVSDSGGIARFNNGSFTAFVNQQVTISGFVTNTAYNGIYLITTVGSTWFEVATIPFGTNEAGSFFSNSVTLTDTGTTLENGDSIKVDTDLGTDYDVGTYIYNKQTNTFQINATWTATETGTWSTKSFNEESKYVEVSNSGDSEPSQSSSVMAVKNNAASTTITGGWDPLNLGTVVIGKANSRFKLINAVTGEREYTGLTPIKLTGTVNISATKSGGTVTHTFRMIKTVDTESSPFDVNAEGQRGIGTTIGSVSWSYSGTLYPGDRFRPEVLAASGTTVIVIGSYSGILN